MSAGIPVMVYLDPETFKALEKISKETDKPMRSLIEWGARRIAGTAKMPRARRARRREFDETVVSEWVIAHSMGVSQAVIAERYGVSKSIVSKRLAERGHSTEVAA